MKNRNIFLTAAVAVLAMAFTTATVEYKVDTKQSKVTWLGKKVTGEHSGGISISEGKLVLTGKAVTGGSFDINMTSITNTDISDEGTKQKLIGHLKGEDFFSTEKYPKATFVITKITASGKNQYAVKGNLTIKGITKEITFPATIETVGNQVKAKAKIIVDRTKYDIKYGSGSFFDGLGDKAINNEFELNVELVANK